MTSFKLKIGLFIVLLDGILVQLDLSHEFFARSPQNMALRPYFGENVQKTRVTGLIALKSRP